MNCSRCGAPLNQSADTILRSCTNLECGCIYVELADLEKEGETIGLPGGLVREHREFRKLLAYNAFLEPLAARLAPTWQCLTGENLVELTAAGATEQGAAVFTMIATKIISASSAVDMPATEGEQFALLPHLSAGSWHVAGDGMRAAGGPG